MLAKKIALGLGIAFVFPILIHYGVHYGVISFVPPPEYNAFVHSDTFTTADSKKEIATFQKELAEFKRENAEYQEASRRYEHHLPSKLFVVTVAVGLIALLVGAFLRPPAIGTGLMLGGIFTICDACYSYSSQLPDKAVVVISLLVALGLLIFLGYRRFERKAI